MWNTFISYKVTTTTKQQMPKTTKETIRQTWNISKIQHTYCIAVWFGLFLAEQHKSIFLINIIKLSESHTLNNDITRGIKKHISDHRNLFDYANYKKFGNEKGYIKNITTNTISGWRNTQSSAIRKQLLS